MPASRNGSWSWSREGVRKRAAASASTAPRRARRAANQPGWPARTRASVSGGAGSATQVAARSSGRVDPHRPELRVAAGEELLDRLAGEFRERALDGVADA